MPQTFASSLIISATALLGRTFLRYGTKELKVEGLPILMNALQEGNMEVAASSKDKGKGRAVEGADAGANESTSLVPAKRRRGIVTSQQLTLFPTESAAHLSMQSQLCHGRSFRMWFHCVPERPVSYQAWGVLPASTQWPRADFKTTSRNARWTLGGMSRLALSRRVRILSAHGTARDIMFTNPLFSKFFDLGQVINTERGGGVFQPAIDQAVKLLQDGEWVRAVHAPSQHAEDRSTFSPRAKSTSGILIPKAG